MSGARDILRDGLQDALADVGVDLEPDEILLEQPRDRRAHGDWSSNVALTVYKRAGLPPRRLAEQLVTLLTDRPPRHVEQVEVAGPGFVNFRLSPSWLHEALREAVAAGVDDYARHSVGSEQSISVEFVSANPTGPLHAGPRPMGRLRRLAVPTTGTLRTPRRSGVLRERPGPPDRTVRQVASSTPPR